MGATEMLKVKDPYRMRHRIPVADHPLRTVEEAKTCAFIEKDLIFGELGKGKTTYLCQVKDDPRCWTNCVRLSSTCVKCKIFTSQKPPKVTRLTEFVGGN